MVLFSVSAVVRGFDTGFVPAPPHQVHVQSRTASGFFTVGVCSCFPIDGVGLNMGNDIVRSIVYRAPKAVNVPILECGRDD